jgi:purine-nucleoside phosphorylase
MATPHNTAEKGQIAKTVLMPGDPLRAKFIAETYLEKAVEFNHVRGMLGYTGVYKGLPVSVMGSGMGMPSIGIYSWELFTHYDVDNIIRIGTAGSYSEELKLFDVVLVTEAFSESGFARCQSGFTGNVIKPSESLCGKLRQSAAKQGVPLVEGRTHSSDVFYYQLPGDVPAWQRVRDEHNCIVVEMESFALFHNAAVTGKNGACILTVSDTIADHQVTTPEEREKRFTRMMEVALGTL